MSSRPRDRRSGEFTRIVFGPVPSRRLGRSLGIAHLPQRTCTYSCIYCQVGRTVDMRLERASYHHPRTLEKLARTRVEEARAAGLRIDHLTLVPDGEPTLDVGLAGTLRLLRPLGIPVAVLTNGSLLWRSDVREAMAGADQVFLKVDSARPETWRRVNRPHGRLDLATVLDGMRDFAADFPGTLSTETMLVADVNDGEDELRATAAFTAELRPDTAYLAIPSRPPAEPWVQPPDPDVVARAYEIFRARHPRVELLTGYEGDAFSCSGDVADDLLAITAVHPMRETAVRRMLEGSGVPWAAVEELVAQGELVEARYGSNRYFLRPTHRPLQ